MKSTNKSIRLGIIGNIWQFLKIFLMKHSTPTSNKPVHNNDFGILDVLDSLFLQVQFFLLALKAYRNELLMTSVIFDKVIRYKAFADINDSIVIDNLLNVVFFDIFQIQIHIAELANFLHFFLPDFSNESFQKIVLLCSIKPVI
jgi:hypothetical protein